jgi:hypothetical protein
MFRFAVSALFSAFVLLFAAACSHYRLGTGVERDFETLFVPPVETAGELPQASAILTTQIRESFIRDGRIRIVNTPEEADAVLTVKVARYSRRALTGTPGDSGLARSLGITLETTATLSDPAGGKVWFTDRPIRVERQIFTDDGNPPGPPSFLQPVQQTQAEYQLVPQLAEPLAERLVGAVLDTW